MSELRDCNCCGGGKTGDAQAPAVVEDNSQKMKQSEVKTLSLGEVVQRVAEILSQKGMDQQKLIDSVGETLQKYDDTLGEWRRFQYWNKELQYTRNLIATDDATFTFILMCWNPGQSSCIHSHAGSECFMLSLQGTVRETRYHNPKEEDSSVPLDVMRVTTMSKGDLKWINDNEGLHKVCCVGDEPAITLHCYIPPYKYSQVWDDPSSSVSHPSPPIVFHTQPDSFM